MEEDVISLIEYYHPGDAAYKAEYNQLRLTWDYIHIESQRQIRLFHRKLVHKAQTPQATLCVVHGFAEHSAKYMSTVVKFAMNGFEVHLIDLRNSGYSGGARCAHNLNQLQEDITYLLRQANPNLPCFMWGQSMGGLLLSTFLLNNPHLNIAGAILTSSFYSSRNLKTGTPKTDVMEKLGPGMKEILVNSRIHLTCLSRDDVYIKNLIKDSKLFPLTNPDMIASMSVYSKNIIKEAKKFKHPAIFFHGSADTLTSPQGTVDFYNACGSQDKLLKIYEGSYHEIQHDLDREKFYEDVLQWTLKRLGSKPLGQLGDLKVGPPGLPQHSSWRYYLYSLLAIAYLICAVKFNPEGSTILMDIFLYKVIPKVFWPLYWVVKKLV